MNVSPVQYNPNIENGYHNNREKSMSVFYYINPLESCFLLFFTSREREKYRHICPLSLNFSRNVTKHHKNKLNVNCRRSGVHACWNGASVAKTLMGLNGWNSACNNLPSKKSIDSSWPKTILNTFCFFVSRHILLLNLHPLYPRQDRVSFVKRQNKLHVSTFLEHVQYK